MGICSILLRYKLGSLFGGRWRTGHHRWSLETVLEGIHFLHYYSLQELNNPGRCQHPISGIMQSTPDTTLISLSPKKVIWIRVQIQTPQRSAHLTAQSFMVFGSPWEERRKQILMLTLYRDPLRSKKEYGFPDSHQILQPYLSLC